jgi:hypothetical protein
MRNSSLLKIVIINVRSRESIPLEGLRESLERVLAQVTNIEHSTN